MGFMERYATTESPGYKLFKQLWGLFADGEKHAGIPPECLLSILQVIRGNRNPEEEISEEPAENAKGLQKYVRINEEDVEFYTGGEKKFAQHFHQFYLQRNFYEAQKFKRHPSSKVPTVEITVTSKPTLSAKSQQLGQQAAEKWTVEGKTDIVDRLLNKDKVMSEKKAKKAKDIRQQQELKDNEQMTFTP